MQTVSNQHYGASCKTEKYTDPQNKELKLKMKQVSLIILLHFSSCIFKSSLSLDLVFLQSSEVETSVL